MLFAAICPLFAPQMLAALGNGWTYTVGAAFFLLCSGAIPIVILYGHRWRPKPPPGWPPMPAASSQQPLIVKIDDDTDKH